jgi:hypothetical protein
VYDLTVMESDAQALRQWLDRNGHRGVPLDVNEFGSGGAGKPVARRSEKKSRQTAHPIVRASEREIGIRKCGF